MSPMEGGFGAGGWLNGRSERPLKASGAALDVVAVPKAYRTARPNRRAVLPQPGSSSSLAVTR